MGNVQSSEKKTPGNIPFKKIIERLYTDYILTNNFKELQNLNRIEYCNDLVVLTSKVMENNLSNLEIEYLAQHLQGNKEVNYMKKDKVYYVPKRKISRIDVRNKTHKKRLCSGIAKFYIKVAHIYAAIATTVIPSSNDLGRSNMCNERVKALKKNSTRLLVDGRVNVFPSFCGMKGEVIGDESGVRELEELYYDDYDFTSGKFVGMTKKSRKDYERDVKIFYKTFTGKKCPSDIKTFAQVPLRDYRQHSLCHVDVDVDVDNNLDNNTSQTDSESSPNERETVSRARKLKDRLMIKYANHIQEMLKSAENKRNKLIAIIDKLFVYDTIPDQVTGKNEIIVNPALNMNMLDEIVRITRKHISELYVDCEKNFAKGLDIFEAIVQTQMMQTSQKQIQILERLRYN